MNAKKITGIIFLYFVIFLSTGCGAVKNYNAAKKERVMVWIRAQHSQLEVWNLSSFPAEFRPGNIGGLKYPIVPMGKNNLIERKDGGEIIITVTIFPDKGDHQFVKIWSPRYDDIWTVRKLASGQIVLDEGGYITRVTSVTLINTTGQTQLVYYQKEEGSKKISPLSLNGDPKIVMIKNPPATLIFRGFSRHSDYISGTTRSIEPEQQETWFIEVRGESLYIRIE